MDSPEFGRTLLKLGGRTAMARKLARQRNEESRDAAPLWIASEPPGYWNSLFILELEEALSLRPDESNVPVEKVVSAGHLLYLHYVDRLEWFDAERVLTRVVDLPGAEISVRGDGPFDLVNTLHAIHLSLWGRNRLGGRSAFARVSPQASIQRTHLAEGAKAAIALAAGDYEKAVLTANSAKRMVTRTRTLTAIDRLMLSWWEEVITRSNASLRPLPLSVAPPSSPVSSRLFAFPAERSLSTYSSDRFAWDPGVPSDFRAEWILRRRPVVDLSG